MLLLRRGTASVYFGTQYIVHHYHQIPLPQWRIVIYRSMMMACTSALFWEDAGGAGGEQPSDDEKRRSGAMPADAAIAPAQTRYERVCCVLGALLAAVSGGDS